MAFENSTSSIDNIVDSIINFSRFQFYYLDNLCWRAKINSVYKTILIDKADESSKTDWWGPLGRNKDELTTKAKSIKSNNIYIFAAEEVYRKKLSEAQTMLQQCLQNTKAQTINDQTQTDQTSITSQDSAPRINTTSPFDRRLDRLFYNNNGITTIIPHDAAYKQSSTIGYITSEKVINEVDISDKDKILEAVKKNKEQMKKDDFFIGVPSLTNNYAIIKLYGSKGGEYLLNRKNERKWYEIDQTNENNLGFSLNPTTTSIISWGNGDPYGRTPYNFSDFVFSKWWNIIQNNRLITLRRYAAPIVDNLKFPGMDGTNDQGIPAKNDNKNGIDGAGSGSKITFPPMATAITYFGEETGNTLSEILKFTSGLNWGEAEANLWEVNSKSTPDINAGPGEGIFGNLTKYAKMFNIAQGNFNNEAILNQGQLPPDPYKDGPYENQIIGPVNRITKVKKREAGIKYENTISLTFNYIARPVGGINLKAALLDILSNFLVLGSASAVFWGGQHRFMGDPQRYPFIGGDKGIQQWYRGDPVGWGSSTIDGFSDGLTNVGSNVIDFAKNFFNTILGKGGNSGDAFGGIKNLLSGDKVAGNAIKAYAAEKSTGQIPYLMGLKALLIGEPVGEWHVTIGNPLNPIAMIGNLICDNIEVEFNDELGPDDFPTEMKIIVNLQHAMARDRDAIQSIFNRGMGRIYELPDEFAGSADYESKVDKYSGNADKTGRNPVYYRLPIADSTTIGGKWGKSAIRENSMQGEVSVWNRNKFSSVSNNTNLDFIKGDIKNRSIYRAADWVSLKSLK